MEEMAQAVQCFSHNLIEGTVWAGEEFDASACSATRWDAGEKNVIVSSSFMVALEILQVHTAVGVAHDSSEALLT